MVRFISLGAQFAPSEVAPASRTFRCRELSLRVTSSSLTDPTFFLPPSSFLHHNTSTSYTLLLCRLQNATTCTIEPRDSISCVTPQLFVLPPFRKSPGPPLTGLAHSLALHPWYSAVLVFVPPLSFDLVVVVFHIATLPVAHLQSVPRPSSDRSVGQFRLTTSRYKP